ncbi:translation initiation factor eIF-1A [archaeon]|jgi:translation initiation factor 1A|nr:translation initiation factor eIF-1A [archaeon]
MAPKEKGKHQQDNQPLRVRTPRAPEILGSVVQRLGGSRMTVSCFDGKSRLCRIPGRLKKFLWVREGDIVLIKPWEFQADTKGDIVYKYNKNQVFWLKQKGYLKEISEFNEF